MEIIVRGKHYEVPDAVQERAHRKFGRLEHYLPALQDATVEVHLGHEKAKQPELRYTVHVAVSGHGVHLQAEEHAAQPEKAIDDAAHVLTRQAQRQKQRLYRRRRRQPNAREGLLPEDAEEPDEAEPGDLDKITLVRHISVKPMTPEEALEQMELSGDDFFVFHDSDVDQFALLYRRDAGDFGLIIPELS